MKEYYITMKIRREDRNRLKKLAQNTGRTMLGQIKYLLDKAEKENSQQQ